MSNASPPAARPCFTTAEPRVGETVRISSTTNAFSNGFINEFARFCTSPGSLSPSMINCFPSGTWFTTGALMTSPSSTIAMRSTPGRRSLVRAIILSVPGPLRVIETASACWGDGVASAMSAPPRPGIRLSRIGRWISLPSWSLLLWLKAR